MAIDAQGADAAIRSALADMDPRGKPRTRVGRPRSAIDDDYDAAVTQLTRELVSDVESLVGTKNGEDYDTIQRVFLAAHAESRAVLEVELARHLIPSIDSAAKRFWDLVGLLRTARPSKPVLRFLRRASKCYLLGLAPECIIMCRAVLENAINDRYSSAKLGRPRNTYGMDSMRATLQDSATRGWLGDESAEEVYGRIWLRGNKAAHSDPEAAGHALETLSLTMSVLANIMVDAPHAN